VAFETFEINEFRGLVTGTPKGTGALGFRVLEGFVFNREVGALGVAPGRSALFTNESAVTRLLALWDAPSNAPAVYTQDATNAIRYRASWVTAGGAALSLGVSTKVMLEGWRGKFGIVPYVALADPQLNAGFLTPTGLVTNDIDPSAFFAAAAVAAGSGGSLTIGQINVSFKPLKRITVGSDSWYVEGSRGNPYSTFKSATTTAGNQTVDLTWSGADAVAVAVSYGGNPLDTTTAWFNAGVYTSSPVSISQLPLEAFPVGSAGAEQTPWHPFVNAEVSAYRQERLWLAKNVRRTNPVSAGTRDLNVMTGATVLFSELGRPWAFPDANFINLPITGDITAMANLGSSLMVFSDAEVFSITGNSANDFVAQRIDAVQPGCINGNSVQEWAGRLYYLARDGVYAVSGAGSEIVSDTIRDAFFNVSTSTVVSSGVDRTNGEYYLSLDGVCYILDLRRGAWRKAPFIVNALETGPKVICSQGASVYALTDVTTPQTAVLQTEFMDFGAPEVDKFFRAFRVLMQNDTAQSATVSVTPVKEDGTLYPALPAQTVTANSRARLKFNLPGYAMTGRGIALRVTVTGLPGVLLHPDLSVDWMARGRRGR
jgi:hypothetical protein